MTRMQDGKKIFLVNDKMAVAAVIFVCIFERDSELVFWVYQIHMNAY
jgi:hypothetical protein